MDEIEFISSVSELASTAKEIEASPYWISEEEVQIAFENIRTIFAPRTIENIEVELCP